MTELEPQKKLRSSVLMIGCPDQNSNRIGADYVARAEDVAHFDYPIVVFCRGENSNSSSINQLIQKTSGSTWILIGESLTSDEFTTLVNYGHLYYFVPSFADATLETTIHQALDALQMNAQKEALKKTLRQQTTILKNESAELTDERAKREKNLARARKRSSTMNRQVEGLHQALLAVHKAQSSSAMEMEVYNSMKDILDLQWVRIFFQTPEQISTHIERLRDVKTFQAPLQSNGRDLGTIVFARQSNRSFAKTEEEALLQIADSISFSLDRIAKIDQAEILKQQWDATFNAISEPLCLTNEKFQIFKTNDAFLNVTGLKSKDTIGAHCFKAFYGTHQKSSTEEYAPTFFIQRANTKTKELRTYEVTTQSIRARVDEPAFFLILFRDVTEQKRIEKEIFESAKMVELGTIGSSIAHDINNPLGGMISFLQLIKMDLKPNDPLQDDILEMEAAGKKCKEIVENLLRFSRRHDEGEKESVDLIKLVNRSLKMVELQVESQGIAVQVKSPDGPTHVWGFFNPLSQALSHIFQNAAEAVSEKLKQEPRSTGSINVEVRRENDGPSLSISDNGIGISPELQNKILNPMFSTKDSTSNQGLGLTLAYKIVSEHGGRLEIFSQPNIGTTVKISFPNV